MKKTVKYGLTTALRTFDEPDVWDGHETIRVSGAVVLADAYLDTQRMVTLGVEKNASGNVTIERTVFGNARTHVLLGIEEGANVTITETITGDGSLRSNTRVSIGARARVAYTIVQELSQNALALLHYEADTVDATLAWLFVGLGARTTQAHVRTNAGSNSTITNNAVLYGTRDQEFDIHVATNHTGPGSTSNMLTRSVLDGTSRAVYHGLIHIGPHAPNCDSYQKDEVILLSDTAGADAIPNLEIQNNRVRCTHGASIGKLDEEKLFYLTSRGITTDEAKRMITEGFLFAMLPLQLHEKIRVKAGGENA